MNLFEKMNAIKIHLSTTPMKKSGWNDFSKYYYFELQDFEPEIIKKCHELGVYLLISYGSEFANLAIFDVQKPEDRLEVTVRNAEATLKGAQAIQNRGAEITYLRRYLLTTAFEILENEIVDSQEKQEPEQQKSKPKKKADSEKNFNDIYLELRSFDNDALVAQVVKELGNGKKLAELTQPEQVKILQRVRFLAVNQDPQGETAP